MFIGTVATNGLIWSVEIATTSKERDTGLTNRLSLPLATGMLFVLPSEKIVTLDASKMRFPVGVVFIDEDMFITETLYPLNPGDKYTSISPCRMYLEANVNEVAVAQPGRPVVLEGYSVPAAAGALPEFLKGLLPQYPWVGPPLPRFLAIAWP